MTVLATTHHAIVGRFETLIKDGGDGGAPLPTIYGDTGPNEPPDAAAWARVTVRQATRERSELGVPSVRSRAVGVLLVEVYVEAATGDSAILALADRVRVAFENVSASGVTFRTPRFEGGSTPTRVGKWVRLLLVCPYLADDLT